VTGSLNESGCPRPERSRSVDMQIYFADSRVRRHGHELDSFSYELTEQLSDVTGEWNT
jgi:hypothetical protein